MARLQQLARDIEGTDPERAEVAAMRLYGIEAARAVPLLLAGLRRHTALEVVEAIEGALTSYGAEAVDALIELAQDPSAGPIARASAASTLSEIGDRSALPALARLREAGVDDPWVRAFVAIAVAELGGDVPQAELQELAAHPNPLIGERADALLRSP
jgi:HEAT repeat protein